MKLFFILVIAALAATITSCNKETLYGRTAEDTGMLVRDPFIPPPPPPPPPAASPYTANLNGFIKFMNDHAAKQWAVNHDNSTSNVYFGWVCQVKINGTPIHQQGIWYWVPTEGYIPTAFPYIHQNLKDTATPGSSPGRSVIIGTNVKECPYFFETTGMATVTVTAGSKSFRWTNVPWLIQQNKGTETLPFAGKDPRAIEIVIP